MPATSLALTIRWFVFGSNAEPPHSPPPSYQGMKRTVPTFGGAQGRRSQSLIRSSTNARASGVRFVISKSWRLMTTADMGWVGAVTSPGRVLGIGVSISWMSYIDSPVSRSKT